MKLRHQKRAEKKLFRRKGKKTAKSRTEKRGFRDGKKEEVYEIIPFTMCTSYPCNCPFRYLLMPGEIAPTVSAETPWHNILACLQMYKYAEANAELQELAGPLGRH